MKKSRFKISLVIMLFIGLLFLCSNVYASQEMQDIHFDVVLESNGDMKITENWKIELIGTDTLFKAFKMDGSFKEITDVKVSEVLDKNEILEFKKCDEYKYHVDENEYQALINPDGLYEIAFGAKQDYEEVRDFIISYTVKSPVKKYADCSEIYWQLVPKDFAVPIYHASATVKLPSAVSNKDNLRAWAHGPLNGLVEIVDESTVNYEVDNIDEETMFEIRVATLEDVYPMAANVIDEAKLDSILAEEQEFADDANSARQRNAFLLKLKNIGLYILNGFIIVFAAVKMVSNFNKLSTIKKYKPVMEVKYFRDLPDEKASPADAAYFYYFNKMSGQVDKILSATIMSLANKGWIGMHLIRGEKKTFGKKDDIVEITIKEKGKELTKDEQKVYDFLKSVPKESETTFTLDQFKKKCESSPTKLQKLLENFEKTAKENAIANKLFSKDDEEIHNDCWIGLGVYVTAFCMMVLAFGTQFETLAIINMILLGINIVMLLILQRRRNGLNQAGVDMQNKWRGLKNYMEEFSLLKDKEIPDLVLWEHYLVYATVFGIADKVVDQLKTIYPDAFNPDNAYDESSPYGYLGMYSSKSYSTSSFVSSISSASIGTMSSGSGYGGGFSSGGGGGGGGGCGGGR